MRPHLSPEMLSMIGAYLRTRKFKMLWTNCLAMDSDVA